MNGFYWTSLGLFVLISSNFADISHLFGPEFSVLHFPHHQVLPQHPFQVPFLVQQQPQLSPQYGPPAATDTDAEAAPVTPSPVPPTRPPQPSSTTTEFFLPEIIENRSAKERSNFIPLRNQYLPPSEMYPSSPNRPYYYPKPVAPTASTSTSTTTARPSPIVFVDPSSSGYDYREPSPVAFIPPRPISTPAPVYLPPAVNFSSDDVGLVQHIDAHMPALRVHLKEMRCLRQQESGIGGSGFLRAILKVDSFIGAAPTVDTNSPEGSCELKLSRSFVLVDVAEPDFERCGVRSCGKDLCLRLRFPAIRRGLRTGSDAILTLHCKSLERVAVKTHALQMGVADDIQARSIGTYAHGGAQNPFRTYVELLRKMENGYKRLEPNGVVQLGEEVMLRAHVNAGDGWNFTKLSDVSLQRISRAGELMNSATLITARGCVNPSMQGVCTQPPIFEPPLGHRLLFKAVMFEGMHSGDELVISMRISGCLEHHDCHVNQLECNARRRRSSETQVKPGNETETFEISKIPFRIVMPHKESEQGFKALNLDPMPTPKSATEPFETVRLWSLLCALGFVVALILLAIFATIKLSQA